MNEKLGLQITHNLTFENFTIYVASHSVICAVLVSYASSQKGEFVILGHTRLVYVQYVCALYVAPLLEEGTYFASTYVCTLNSPCVITNNDYQ